MGYSWTPISKGDIIKAAHFNEIKNNLEDLYNDLQLDPPSWTYFPVSVGEVILKAHIDELRDKTDYADDMNYCRNYCSGLEITVYPGANTGYYGTHKKTQKNNVETGYCSPHNSNADNGEDTGANITHYSHEDTDDNSPYYITVFSSVKNSALSLYFSSAWEDHDTYQATSVKSTNHVSHKSSDT